MTATPSHPCTGQAFDACSTCLHSPPSPAARCFSILPLVLCAGMPPCAATDLSLQSLSQSLSRNTYAAVPLESDSTQSQGICWWQTPTSGCSWFLSSRAKDAQSRVKRLAMVVLQRPRQVGMQKREAGPGCAQPGKVLGRPLVHRGCSSTQRKGHASSSQMTWTSMPLTPKALALSTSLTPAQSSTAGMCLHESPCSSTPRMEA